MESCTPARGICNVPCTGSNIPPGTIDVRGICGFSCNDENATWVCGICLPCSSPQCTPYQGMCGYQCGDNRYPVLCGMCGQGCNPHSLYNNKTE